MTKKILAEPLPRPDYSENQTKTVALWDESNPHSLVRMVPPVLATKIKELPMEMIGTSLKDHRRRYKISMVDEELRQAFWDEYFSSCDVNKKMRVEAVYGRSVSKEYFYSFIVHVPEKLSFMIKPPTEYMYRMQCLLEMGLDRFYDILKLPLQERFTNAQGEVVRRTNVKLIGEVIKIMAIVDTRIHGAIPQRIEQKNLNVNMDYASGKSVEELESELKTVENEIKRLADGKKEELLGESYQGVLVESGEDSSSEEA